jgi:N-dimethylarginine dimethylaminohydrolase
MISSYNEWDPLKSIVVGRADHANWPVHDKVFRAEAATSLWTETPAPSGPVEQWIIDETNEDLDQLCKVLGQAGAEVLRPDNFNFQAHDGLYNYCPRDRFLVYGNTVVNPAMMYPCRDMEYQSYLDIMLEDAGRILHMPQSEGLVMDAANVLRLGDRMLMLESASGNRLAYEWLCRQFPGVRIELCNFYAGVHIDSTITPLREGFVVVNASRVTPETLPKCFANWEVMWVNDVVPQAFHNYPYASKWVGMNMLSIDENTVIIDAAQTQLIKDLDRVGITSIPLTLRHSRTLGGSFHCVTLDLIRE